MSRLKQIDGKWRWDDGPLFADRKDAVNFGVVKQHCEDVEKLQQLKLRRENLVAEIKNLEDSLDK